jgi:hypothetical protein
LGHATQEANDLVLTMLLASFQGLHFADRFLLRHVADRAGVKENDVSVVFALDQVIAPPGQIARDLFRVANIHLAAVRFNEDRRHGALSLPEMVRDFE